MSRIGILLRYWTILTGAALSFTLAALAASAPATAASQGCVPADLRAKLSAIESKFGAVQVISTFRQNARIAGTGHMSYHASCRAVDFNPPAGKYQQVVEWLRANHNGGVGTYSCGMHHIHIDNGARVRFHKCQGSGQYASKSRGGKKYAYAKRGSKRYASSGRTGRRYAAARGGRRYASNYAYAKRSSYRTSAARKSTGRYATGRYRSNRYSDSSYANRRRG